MATGAGAIYISIWFIGCSLVLRHEFETDFLLCAS